MLFNKSAELLFGVASETAVNMTLSRFLPHRLKGARRLDTSRNFGARLSTYRLHNVTHEFAVRHNGEHFPFEATIFKNGQRGKCTYLILLKDLTTTEANSTADAQHAGPISQRDSPDIPADSAHRFNADTRASHFELVVSDSVCDATFAWLGTIASQENLAAPQTLSMAHPFPSLTQNIQQITIKEFINNYIHIDDRAAVKHQWKNALRSGSDVDCVYRLILSDGSVQLVRHWMAQTMKNDTARYFEGVLHKIEHTTAPAPSINMLPANDTDQPAQHDERRRSQPSDTEAGRLYQQLQCRIMTFESAREAQQKHLAREMHDDFGQLLTAMKMDLIVLQGQLNKVDHRLSQQLGDVSNLVDAMVISVRRIIANLPPQTIGQHGLVRSLELMTEAHTKRHRIPCRLQIQPQLPELDDVIVMPIYRIVQEALNNVAKHARATEIDICIMQHEETLHLSISDNGTGITETALRNPGGFGLISMRERIVTLNGKMAIDTTPGSGTTIRVVIPIDLEMAS